MAANEGIVSGTRGWRLEVVGARRAAWGRGTLTPVFSEVSALPALGAKATTTPITILDLSPTTSYPEGM